MTDIDNKQTMRVAMVGVSPADQITFKGYLRVLLRLDVQLNWVSAQTGVVDLYVINEDFKYSNSVIKMLDANPNTPTMYVSRSLTGEGGVDGNSLTLPLKKINILNDWLYQNVPLLKKLSNHHYRTTDDIVINAESSASDNSSASTPSTKPSLDRLIEMVNTLQTRSDSMFELMQAGEVIALIHASKQRVWLRSKLMPKVEAWHLRVYGGETPDAKFSLDMNQWLYQAVWSNADSVLSLLNPQMRYQLHSWVKPEDNADRRDLLKIMTAIEGRACNADEIVLRTGGVDKLTVQKVLVALLISQNLVSANYQNLSVQVVESTDLPPPVSPVPKAEPVKSEPEQVEKMGFLSRLRRRLGL